MCILVTKKKGVVYPSVETVKNCMRANPDGFAMAFNFKGKVVTFKTLDADEFLEAYINLTKNADRRDTGLMLHMRIATHGTVREENCHCWLADVLGEEMAFAHNGILSIPNRDDMTDSETFLRDYLEPCQSVAELFETIDNNIGNSKFAFIDGDGNIMRFGNFITDRGVNYSNASYVRNRYSFMSADPRLWSKAKAI